MTRWCLNDVLINSILFSFIVGIQSFCFLLYDFYPKKNTLPILLPQIHLLYTMVDSMKGFLFLLETSWFLFVGLGKYTEVRRKEACPALQFSIVDSPSF